MPHKLCPLGEDQDFVNPRRSVAYAMLGDRIGYIPKRLVMPDRSSEGRYMSSSGGSYPITSKAKKIVAILILTKSSRFHPSANELKSSCRRILKKEGIAEGF
ncbi:hypothetical protein YC2023_109045 [Brassica napus]